MASNVVSRKIGGRKTGKGKKRTPSGRKISRAAVKKKKENIFRQQTRGILTMGKK